MNWSGLLLAITAGLLAWYAIRMVKRNPGSFSKANISKSLTTMGFLTLLIIVVVAFCVMMLNN